MARTKAAGEQWRKNVGIWKHFRTKDHTDALKTVFKVDGYSCRAQLYFAPADFTNPTSRLKRPYLVVWVKANGVEIRKSSYVGSEEYFHPVWYDLRDIALDIGRNQLEGAVAETIFYHEEMLSRGCTYTPHECYNFPIGSDADSIMREANAACLARLFVLYEQQLAGSAIR